MRLAAGENSPKRPRRGGGGRFVLERPARGADELPHSNTRTYAGRQPDQRLQDVVPLENRHIRSDRWTHERDPPSTFRYAERGQPGPRVEVREPARDGPGGASSAHHIERSSYFSEHDDRHRPPALLTRKRPGHHEEERRGAYAAPGGQSQGPGEGGSRSDARVRARAKAREGGDGVGGESWPHDRFEARWEGEAAGAGAAVGSEGGGLSDRWQPGGPPESAAIGQAAAEEREEEDAIRPDSGGGERGAGGRSAQERPPGPGHERWGRDRWDLESNSHNRAAVGRLQEHWRGMPEGRGGEERRMGFVAAWSEGREGGDRWQRGERSDRFQRPPHASSPHRIVRSSFGPGGGGGGGGDRWKHDMYDASGVIDGRGEERGGGGGTSGEDRVAKIEALLAR
eukprot:jgi/Mesen1/5728/ME000029S05041